MTSLQSKGKGTTFYYFFIATFIFYFLALNWDLNYGLALIKNVLM